MTEVTAVNKSDIDFRRKLCHQYFFEWNSLNLSKAIVFYFSLFKTFCKKEHLAHSQFIFVRLKIYHWQDNLFFNENLEMLLHLLRRKLNWKISFQDHCVSLLVSATF